METLPEDVLVSPIDIGLPSKFKSWRPGQWEAIQDGVHSSKRFIGQVQKPGAGKSACAVAQALITNSRTMILTGLKGLQDQLSDEFGELGLEVLKGKSSYTCECNPEHTCEEGTIGKCHYRGSSLCPWAAAKQAVMEAQISTTNYSCWIAANRYGGGLGSYDLLVLDEAHNAPGYLAQAMKITISSSELEKIKWKWPDEREEMEEWKEWARLGRSRTQDYLQALKLKLDSTPKPSQVMIRDFRHFTNLSRKMSDIASCSPDEWVCDSWSYGYQFDPINVHSYAERYLFHGIAKVILTSGTIRPRTLQMLGIPEDEFDFFDYPGEIRPSKSPMIFIPTAYVHKGSDEKDLMKIVRRVDEIMEAECEYRGLIHTANFPIRDFIYSHSQYQRYMHSNWTQQGDVTSQVISRFKETPPPIALISPSITTGYDFLGDFARYQIVVKLPFPNLKASKVDQERERLDPTLGIYQMWQALAQEFGRADRAEDDWQRFYILDNTIEKMMFRYSDLAPPWLPAYYRKSLVVPMITGEGWGS